MRTVFSVGSWIDRLSLRAPSRSRRRFPLINRSGAGVKTILPCVYLGPSPQTSRCSITPPSVGDASSPHIVGCGSSRHNMKCLDAIPVPLVLSSSVANHEPIMYMSCAKKRRQALCDVPFPASSLPHLHDGSDDAMGCSSVRTVLPSIARPHGSTAAAMPRPRAWHR